MKVDRVNARRLPKMQNPGGLGGALPPEDATGGMVPYYIAAGDTFTVPLYKQALFSDTIEVDGILVILGRLNGVD
jgi:hypothetical protein